MKDQGFQYVPDGLVDGSIAAEVAPTDLRAAVNVLRAAGGPGSAAELSTMATYVTQFSAEVDAAAARIGTISNISTAASHDDAPRSFTMFSTRVTRRALSIVAITLLAAGTAAAAAGGALPMFESEDTVVETGDTGVEDEGSDTTDLGDESTDTSLEDGARPNNNGDTDHHGKCTAWANGAPKSASNRSFAELQVSADAAGLTIDEYCVAFLAANGEEDGDGDEFDDESDEDESDDDESDDDDDESDDDESDDDDSEVEGNGKGNSGNRGQGNGKSDD